MAKNTKSIDEISYFLYIGRYFLFMYEQEFNFVKDDVMNANIKRANKMIIDRIKAYDDQFKMQGVKVHEVFQEFNQEKINAIHNVLAMMLNMDEANCLELEDYLINKVK